MLGSFFKASNDNKIHNIVGKLYGVRDSANPDEVMTLGHLTSCMGLINTFSYHSEDSRLAKALVKRIFDQSVSPEKRIPIYSRFEKPVTDLVPNGPLNHEYKSLYDILVFIDRKGIIDAAIDVCRESNSPRQSAKLYDMLERTMRTRGGVQLKETLTRAYFPDQSPTVKPAAGGPKPA